MCKWNVSYRIKKEKTCTKKIMKKFEYVMKKISQKETFE